MTTHRQYETAHATTSSNVDVDAVVREVLRRLNSDRPLAGAAEVQSNGPTIHQQVDPTDVRLSQQVVTLDDIDGCLGRAKTLTVPAGAVVTPAVRDVLKENDITLRYFNAETCDGSQAVHSLVVATAATTFRAADFLAAMTTLGRETDLIESTELSDAVPRLIAAIDGGDRVGVLLSDRGALAACMANRDSRARAAVVRTLDDVNQAVESLGANVLVIEPRRAGIYALRSMVAAFVRSPVRSCPAELALQTPQAKRCTCSSAK